MAVLPVSSDISTVLFSFLEISAAKTTAWVRRASLASTVTAVELMIDDSHSSTIS